MFRSSCQNLGLKKNYEDFSENNNTKKSIKVMELHKVVIKMPFQFIKKTQFFPFLNRMAKTQFLQKNLEIVVQLIWKFTTF